MTLNAVDIFILAVLALSLLFGLLRGFLTEVLSLACWVAAFWVAWVFGPQVAAYYAGFLHDPVARTIAGYVSCFIVVLIVGALIGWGLRKLVRLGGLRGSDRILGMLFGLARGWLLVTFVVLILQFTALPRESPAWQQSALLPWFTASATRLADALPAPVTNCLQTGARAIGKLPATATPSTPLSRRPAMPASASSEARPLPAKGTSPPPNPCVRAQGSVGQ